MVVGNDRDGICSDSCIQSQWFELCDYINFVIKPLDKMMTIELKCEQHEAKEREWDIETDRERECDEKKRTNKENSISSSAHRYSHNQSRSHTATVIVSPRWCYFIVIASAKSFRLRWKCRNSVWWASGSEGVRAREKESERGQEGKLYLCVHCTCCHLNPSLFKWINSVVLSIVWTIENCNIKPDAVLSSREVKKRTSTFYFEILTHVNE